MSPSSFAEQAVRPPTLCEGGPGHLCSPPRTASPFTVTPSPAGPRSGAGGGRAPPLAAPAPRSPPDSPGSPTPAPGRVAPAPVLSSRARAPGAPSPLLQHRAPRNAALAAEGWGGPAAASPATQPGRGGDRRPTDRAAAGLGCASLLPLHPHPEERGGRRCLTAQGTSEGARSPLLRGKGPATPVRGRPRPPALRNRRQRGSPPAPPRLPSPVPPGCGSPAG